MISQPRGLSGTPPRATAGGRQQRLLHRVLAVSKSPYRRTRAARTCGAHSRHTSSRPPGGHWSSPPGHIAGRSSTTPPGWAKCAAISSARSRVAQSMRKKPASCSLVSAYGPSVARWPSGLQPNSVDEAGSPSASALTNSPEAEISVIRASNSRSISACGSADRARPSAVSCWVGCPHGSGLEWIRITYFIAGLPVLRGAAVRTFLPGTSELTRFSTPPAAVTRCSALVRPGRTQRQEQRVTAGVALGAGVRRCGWRPGRRRPRGRRGPGRRGAPRAAPWPRRRARRRRRGPRPSPGARAAGRAPRRAGRRRSGRRRAARAAGRRPGPSERLARAAPAASARPRAGRCRGSCRTRPTRRRCRGCRRRAGRRRRSSRRTPRSDVLDLVGRAGEAWRRTARRWRSASRSCRRPPRGSARAGPRPRRGPDGLADLALDQPVEGLRLDPHGLRPEVGESARRLGRTGSRR